LPVLRDFKKVRGERGLMALCFSFIRVHKAFARNDPDGAFLHRLDRL